MTYVLMACDRLCSGLTVQIVVMPVLVGMAYSVMAYVLIAYNRLCGKLWRTPRGTHSASPIAADEYLTQTTNAPSNARN